MSNSKWHSFLGLAQRAGKVVSGEETVMRVVRQKKAIIVILSEDASERTKKTITNKCAYYQIPLRTVPNREELGHAIGQPSRVLAAVTDTGLGNKLIALFDQSFRG
ncbi:LSU ribosomal protein L7AE [Scopulibacillus darangshiensis]|uniref:LSU ribosomal protein L7AE n=1 Tax=Scopulibacillus darangshiensis TaxID=442528 RepID=A0A4R2P642_9BACL|nr:YlxQ family RNA-binding protein [Scopulibacillus darangshiensis]TCP30293.1 LSU ribosomal protein L7AE [Scopulibacillus darangshiensis]